MKLIENIVKNIVKNKEIKSYILTWEVIKISIKEFSINVSRNIVKQEREVPIIFSDRRSNEEASNVIKNIRNDKNIEVFRDQDILFEIKQFYNRLYTSTKIPNTNIEHYLSQINCTSYLNDKEKENCEKTISELFQAVQNLKRHKSPGIDGIIPEFYQKFWIYLKTPLLNMIHGTYNEGMLPRSSRRSVLTLIYKKGDKDLIKNCRPISLSNYDYKIIAFVLASRIQRVIDKIINKTQTAYIKGWYIGLNARFMLDILEYSNITKKEGAIICLDFEKSFRHCRMAIYAKNTGKI